jgi:formylglycine-generating enzyme required for sulfatase activity
MGGLMRKWALFLVLIPMAVFSQTPTTGWISLENLSETSILSTLDRELKKCEPLLLDDPANKAQADQIETDVRQFIQQEEQSWQKRFAQVFSTVSTAYNKKLTLDASLRFATEDVERLKISLENYDKQILAQQAVIQNSENTKQSILQELSKKLETIPFNTVIFGSADYERSRTPKDMEKIIFSCARQQAVDAVNGTYIQAETQVEQYQLVKDRITATVSGRVQIEQTTNNFFVKALSGSVNKVSVVGLLAVYPWSQTQDVAATPPTAQTPSNLELFQVDNNTFSRLKAYPSAFVQDAQSFLEKAKSQNLTFQSQLRSLLSDIRTRLDQEEQAVIQAKTILQRLESERIFYRQEFHNRQSGKDLMIQQLTPLESDYQKANADYRAFLNERSVYQFQTDFKLDDYNLAPDQMYSNIMKACYDRFKTNIREEFLSWVTVVNFNQLSDYREFRKEIPARLEAARIIYPYVQNNLEGRPTRGILSVFKARFDINGIPDYTPGGNAKKEDLTTTPIVSGRNFTDQSGIEWVFVKGGTFQMGSNNGAPDEKPIHTVTVADYYISKTEVTNAQYTEYLNAYGSDKVKSGEIAWHTLINECDWGVKKIGEKWQASPGYENHPVVYVTWYGANEFCKFYGLRLPTEAEWEFAAKGGNQSNGFIYSGSNNINEVAWYSENSGNKTHRVGTKAANELGIFDMSGNVLEWCSDWYGNYGGGLQNNPQGPSSSSSGIKRVLRGGFGNINAEGCRCVEREWNGPGRSGDIIGFRPVRTP